MPQAGLTVASFLVLFLNVVQPCCDHLIAAKTQRSVGSSETGKKNESVGTPSRQSNHQSIISETKAKAITVIVPLSGLLLGTPLALFGLVRKKVPMHCTGLSSEPQSGNTSAI